MAGYPDEMAELVDANPGLRSRFPKHIHFPDYDADELVAIFEMQCRRSRYELSAEARRAVAEHLGAVPRTKGFGNGRVARNLFEAAVARQASRLAAVAAPTDEQLTTLESGDIPPLEEPGAADGSP